MADDEVGVRAQMRRVQRPVPGDAGLPGHQQRIGVLIDLEEAVRVGGDRSVHERVAGEAAVGLLGTVEQEAHHLPGARAVAVGEQSGERLVAVPREDRPVGVAGVRGEREHRLAPGIGRRRDERSRIGLVLGGLDHVGREQYACAALAGGERSEAS